MTHRRAPARAVVVLVLLSGCAFTPIPSPSAELDPPFMPGSPAPPELIDPLGSILVLRAYSGTFVRHDQRTELALPDVVVFDDGTVVANVALVSDPPDLRAVKLTADELGEVTELLDGAALAPLAAGEGPIGCFDCGATIIRARPQETTIEIAAKGLVTDVRPEWVAQLPYDRGVIALDRLLDVLAKRVRDGPAKPFEDELPLIPVAPYSGG